MIIYFDYFLNHRQLRRVMEWMDQNARPKETSLYLSKDILWDWVVHPTDGRWGLYFPNAEDATIFKLIADNIIYDETDANIYIFPDRRKNRL